MIEMLTIQEASRETGISAKTLGNAASAGRLPATKEELAFGSRYLVSRGALMAYAARHKPQDDTRWSRPWDEADVEALLEMYDTCTLAQMSAYLGRGQSAVSVKLMRLRQQGVLTKEGRASGRARGNPFVIPRTGILIARTCVDCGLLRDASHYLPRTEARRGKSRETRCIRCQRRNDRLKSKKDSHDHLQEASLATGAPRTGQEYTSAEMEVVSDLSKSALQVALELGRTYLGIASKRRVMGLTGERTRHELPEDTHWLIHFPNAMKVLEEHYRALGVVPESEWEWNDDVA